MEAAACGSPCYEYLSLSRVGTVRYFRETWGLSRLWCIPAVVAYVVCMYRIRARLFATVIVNSIMTWNDG